VDEFTRGILEATGNYSALKIYEYVRDFQSKRLHSPSLREIAEKCNISKSTAQRQAKNLISHGYLESDEGKHRSLRLTEKRSHQ